MYTDDQIAAMMQGSPEERDEAMKYFFTDPKLKNTVLNKIRSKGGTEHDAQDAFQEGFKVFHRHLLRGNYQGRSTLYTYFVGICIRCWLDGLKKSFYKKTTLTDDEPTLDEAYRHTPEVELISKERKSQLREILGLLGDRCRKAILMGYQGYSSEEIKKQLDLSGEELVRKVRYRCMTKLRDMMDKEPRLLSLLKSLNYG
ncbi:MAG: sigma-70 family RNA polymerase sigma factor [Phaeodactylibacter sp.]|nr:sigma-70 family RNA polymerase sigma factor [Phaeodactylibacter sp.]